MKSSQAETIAFILHSRAYRETSQIIQLFSLEHGRFSVIAKGIKGKSFQARKAILQPFIQLKLTYAGRSDLKTMIHCEASSGFAHSLKWQGRTLACGYYANELILRSCPEGYAYQTLFQAYTDLIKALILIEGDEKLAISSALRNFEVALLTDLGIAPDWQYDIDQQPIQPQGNYELILSQGFKRIIEMNDQSDSDNSVNQYPNQSRNEYGYSGKSILSLFNGNYEKEVLRSCQHITRRLLDEIIGNKPLQSRKLWQHTS